MYRKDNSFADMQNVWIPLGSQDPNILHVCSFAVMLLEIAFLTNVQEKMCSEPKSLLFWFWPLKTNYQTYMFKNTNSIATHIQPKPRSAQSISKKVVNQFRKIIFLGVKVDKPQFTLSKTTTTKF